MLKKFISAALIYIGYDHVIKMRTVSQMIKWKTNTTQENRRCFYTIRNERP